MALVVTLTPSTRMGDIVLSPTLHDWIWEKEMWMATLGCAQLVLTDFLNQE